jgi:hypothetical protein
MYCIIYLLWVHQCVRTWASGEQCCFTCLLVIYLHWLLVVKMKTIRCTYPAASLCYQSVPSIHIWTISFLTTIFVMIIPFLLEINFQSVIPPFNKISYMVMSNHFRIGIMWFTITITKYDCTFSQCTLIRL